MKDRYLKWWLPASLLVLGGCGWVDSSGRQENRSPGLAELVQVVAEDQADVNLGVADADNNLEKVDTELLSEGQDLASACIESDEVFAGLLATDFANSLEEACDPLNAEQSCSVDIEHSVLTSELRLSKIPVLRRPVARKYRLALRDTDGDEVEQELLLCLRSVSSAPVAYDDAFDVEYNVVRVVDGMEFGANCGPDLAKGVLSNDRDDFDFSEDDANSQQCLVALLRTPPSHHAGAFTLNPDGGFSYGAGLGLSIGEVDTFSYVVSDGVNESEEASVTIHITGQNTAPVAKDPTVTVAEDAGLQTVAAEDLAEDAEGDASTLRLLNVNGGESDTSFGQVSFNTSPAEIFYTANADAFGTESISYRIEDSGGEEAEGTLTIVVNAVNDAPLIEADQSANIAKGAGVSDSLGFTLSDVEDGTVASLTAISDNLAVLSVQSVVQSANQDSWAVSYTTVADGVADLTVTATDSQGLSSEFTTSFTVGSGVQSQPPSLSAASLSATSGVSITWNIQADALASDPDTATSALVFSGSPSSADGTVSYSADLKSLTFVPSGSGAASISVTVEDPEGNQVSGTLSINVAAAQPPVLSSASLSATDGVSVTWTIAGDALASDPDTAAADLVFSGTPASADGTVSYSADFKSLTFVPSGSGAASISVTVEDPEGNQDSGSLSVSVSAAAQPPVLSSASLSATDGVSVTWTIAGDALASDPDTAAADLVFSGTPASADGAVSYSADLKSLTFVPSGSGAASISVTVEDPEGNQDSGSLSVSVSAAAQPPVLSSASLSAIDGVSATWTIAGDALASDPDTAAADLVFSGTPASAGGAVSYSADLKSLTFVPSGSGAASISVTVEDPEGNQVSGSLSVSVSAAAQPPVLSSASLSATDGVSVTWTIAGDALASDPDTAAADLVFSGSPASADGTVSYSADFKSLTFVPSGSGAASISVTVEDPEGNQDSGTLSVSVSAAAQPPVLSSASLSATDGVSVTWTIAGDALASDPDTAAADLVFSGTPASADGTVSYSADFKSLTFVPSGSGAASISVTVEDPEGNQDSGALSVNVSP